MSIEDDIRRLRNEWGILDSAISNFLCERLGVELTLKLKRDTDRVLGAEAAAKLQAWAGRYIEWNDRLVRELAEIVAHVPVPSPPIVTPEDTLREAGTNSARQAAYQRRLSTRLAGRRPLRRSRRSREE